MKPFQMTWMASFFLLISLLSFLLNGCAMPGIYHTVQPGETLGQIARTYGQSESQLARVNGIAAPQSLPQGKRLFIPGATSRRQKVATQSVTASKSVANQTRSSRPLVKKDQKKKAVVHKKSSVQIPKVTLPRVAAGTFHWPLQGALLRRFGDQIPFPCKGVEIAASPGSPVLAAADGRVIYSGDGISSFGNMIILQHVDDFYTVYAFAEKIFVKVGSTVRKKERIALSGVPPQGRSPRLYFEIRHHKEPVDPTFYLP